jgi:hypothetical protein
VRSEKDGIVEGNWKGRGIRTEREWPKEKGKFKVHRDSEQSLSTSLGRARSGLVGS